MAKLRKIMMGMLFAFIVTIGVSTESSDVQAATTKDFKGNLNVTYKNSKWKSKITIKKVNSKKVSVKVVLDNNWTQGTWNGKVISKDTIQFTLDGGEKIKLKWKNKTHFTAKRPKGGFSGESVQLVRRLCFSLNNAKYTQVQKSSTVYYGASHTKEKDKYGLGAVSKMTLKGNKLIVKGSLVRASSKKNLLNEDKGTLLKKAIRTFKLDKNFKAYGCGGESPDQKLTTEEFKSSLKNANGLYLEFIVKNGKLTRLNFRS